MAREVQEKIRGRVSKQTTGRILGGNARGVTFELGVSDTVRPTKNRVLEAGLNMLGSRLDFNNINALDAFCGSGQWGLELLSRGAARVDFVDMDVRLARENVKNLADSEGHNRVDGEAVCFNKNMVSFRPKILYDIIVADPPYTEEELYYFVLKQADWLAEGGFLMLEIPTHLELKIPTTWAVVSEKNYGQNNLVMLKVAS